MCEIRITSQKFRMSGSVVIFLELRENKNYMKYMSNVSARQNIQCTYLHRAKSPWVMHD